MANNKFIGTFESQGDVLSRIEDLKMQGVPEDHMYVMAEDKEQLSLVRGRTDVEYKTSEGSWMDKFVGFMAGDDPTREAISRMGMDTRETDRYYHDVKNGKILLFVDEDLAGQYNDDKTSSYSSVRQDDMIGAGGGGLVMDPTTKLGSDPYLTEGGTKGTLKENDSHMEQGTSVTKKDWQDTQTIDDEDRAYGDSNAWDDTIRQADGTPTTGERKNVINSMTWDPESHDKEENMGHVDVNDYSNNSFNNQNTEEETLKLHEERLSVDKERVKTGEVNVGKHVVEENQTLEVPIEREEIYVERRPVDRNADVTDTNAYQEGQNIRIPLTEERVEVNKKDVVREEIVVGKRKVQDTETVRETVRREEADIDEKGQSEFPKYNEKDGPLNL